MKVVPVAEPGEPSKDPAPAPLSSDTPPPPPPKKSTPAPQEVPVIPPKEGESESLKATDANKVGETAVLSTEKEGSTRAQACIWFLVLRTD